MDLRPGAYALRQAAPEAVFWGRSLEAACGRAICAAAPALRARNASDRLRDGGPNEIEPGDLLAHGARCLWGRRTAGCPPSTPLHTRCGTSRTTRRMPVDLAGRQRVLEPPPSAPTGRSSGAASCSSAVDPVALLACARRAARRQFRREALGQGRQRTYQTGPPYAARRDPMAPSFVGSLDAKLRLRGACVQLTSRPFQFSFGEAEWTYGCCKASSNDWLSSGEVLVRRTCLINPCCRCSPCSRAALCNIGRMRSGPSEMGDVIEFSIPEFRRGLRRSSLGRSTPSCLQLVVLLDARVPRPPASCTTADATSTYRNKGLLLPYAPRLLYTCPIRRLVRRQAQAQTSTAWPYGCRRRVRESGRHLVTTCSVYVRRISAAGRRSVFGRPSSPRHSRRRRRRCPASRRRGSNPAWPVSTSNLSKSPVSASTSSAAGNARFDFGGVVFSGFGMGDRSRSAILASPRSQT